MSKAFIKKILVAVLFIAVMTITFTAVFKDQNMAGIMDVVGDFAAPFLLLAVTLALIYVCMDGVMIWRLMKKEKNRARFIRCLGYAFICFFYSGITPSASGGQPIQLFYMKRDGLSFSRSCAVLTAIEAMKKSILAVSGFVILIAGGSILTKEFEGSLGWFFLGWLIVTFWSVLLWALMFTPDALNKLVLKLTHCMAKIKPLKKLGEKDETINHFFDGYRSVKKILTKTKKEFILLTVLCLLQRTALVAITPIIFKSYGIGSVSCLRIFALQLAIMVSVDMLPLPGSQGISEILYQDVIAHVVAVQLLTPTMLIQRFISFYTLLLLGAVVSLVMHLTAKAQDKKKAETQS